MVDKQLSHNFEGWTEYPLKAAATCQLGPAIGSACCPVTAVTSTKLFVTRDNLPSTKPPFPSKSSILQTNANQLQAQIYAQV